MTAAEKPGDPADRATDAKADGAFGGLTNHRGGYGDDKLARVIGWLRERPTATLASGEGGLLLAEIDRQSAEIDRLRDRFSLATEAAIQSIRTERDRAERILAALREPSEKVIRTAVLHYGGGMQDAIRGAVTAAEKEAAA